MSLQKLNYTKDWNNASDFPTIELNEIKVRADMQYLYDEIKNYINNVLIPQVVASGITEENRESNEAKRQANETRRQTQETARQNAETQRQTAQAAFFNGVSASATTLPAGSQATATAQRDGDSFKVNFGIPKGDSIVPDPGAEPSDCARPLTFVRGEIRWAGQGTYEAKDHSPFYINAFPYSEPKIFDINAWVRGIIPPPEGTAGHVLTKTSNGAEWKEAPSSNLPSPSSGKSDAQLMIAKGVSGEAEWREITETPWSGPGSKRFLTVDGMNAPSGVESGFLPSTATGTAGQVFTKTGTNTADWEDPSVPKPPEVPVGETGWYIPIYGFGPGADFSVTWKEVTEAAGESLGVQHFLLDNGPGMYTRAGFLPSATAGGKAGQVFTRLSEAEAGWADPPKGIPAGGTEGQVLSKTESADYSVAWTDLPAAENNSLNAVVTCSSAPAENGIYVFSESNGGIVWNRAPLENESFSGVWVSTDSQSVYYVFGKFSGSASGGPYVPGEQSVVLVEKVAEIIDDAASKAYVDTAISTAIAGAMEASY